MPTSTSLKDIEKVIALTDRVKLRKHDYLSATPHICAERSRLLTESYKQSDGQPRDIRKAKGFKKVLAAIPVVIRKGELIVGSQSQYIRGAHPPLEWNPHHILELFEGMDMRLSGVASLPAEISEEEKASLLEDVSYWRGKTATDSIRNIQRELYRDMDDLLEARITHDAGMGRVTSSKIADYGKVIEKGLNGVIAKAKERLQSLSFTVEGDSDRYYFLQAVIIACEGVITFAQRHAELAKDLAMRETDAARKRELEKIAEICHRIPANPAHSFHEALQSFWFTHLCINLEHAYDTETPGRMDQYLYPSYQRDVEEGRLTRQEAAELLGCLWVKFTEMEGIKGKVWKAAAQSSQFQDVTIGGVTRDGKDATNELTYLLLEVTRQVKVVQPPLYLRCHKGTPEELWIKAMEVNRDRKDGNPAFVNDQAVVLNFAAKGIPIREARDWAPGGCVHPHVSHASTGDRAMFLNLAKILELTLNNGKDPRTKKQLGAATGDPRSFSSFDELYHAYKNQVAYFVELFVKYHNFFWQIRKNYYSLPFFSALMDDCIMKGLDYLAGGCRYPQLYYNFYDRGHQNVADSLVAVKKLVFEDRKISMDHLLKALEANFEGDGNEDIRYMVLAAPKYGNDDDYADDVFNDFSLWLQRRLNEEKHPLGENSRSIRGGATHHFYAGETVGALPDGRKAWQPLADGSLSPVQGRDKKGPTAAINSATKVNHTEVNTSTLFNLKFMPSILQSRAGLQKLVGLIKTYFDRGGYHVQFNLMGQEVLREAKEYPDRYRDLLVRVAGYSAYFTELASEVQDEIIARTEQDL